MRAGLSFSHPPISLLLRQPLSIKKSYAGAIQMQNNRMPFGNKILEILIDTNNYLSGNFIANIYNLYFFSNRRSKHLEN
jgi:hypothetical protein